MDRNPVGIGKTLEDFVGNTPLVRLKRIKPVVTQVFSLERVEEAHDLIRRNATTGRLAMEIEG